MYVCLSASLFQVDNQISLAGAAVSNAVARSQFDGRLAIIACDTVHSGLLAPETFRMTNRFAKAAALLPQVGDSNHPAQNHF
jgi:hypothetical protein